MEVEKLIEEVRKFPVLYDQTDEKYRNAEYKERVWKIISETLKVPETKRDGDWTCADADCGTLNFAWRTQCFICNEVKPEGAGGGSTGDGSGNKRDGDWTCANADCSNSNFAWRTQCFRCNEDKPGAGGGTAGGEGGGPGRSREFPSQRLCEFGPAGKDGRGGFRGRGGNRGGFGDRGSRGGNRGGFCGGFSGRGGNPGGFGGQGGGSGRSEGSSP